MKPETEPRSRFDTIAAPLLCVLVLVVFADVVVLGQRLFVRDVASYYYPTKKIVRDTILGGEVPLWNRYYAAGQPMAANPEYAVFYPPHLLLLLPGFGWWFQILIVGHVAFGAIGAYRFFRSLMLSGLTAFYGAIVFAFGGLTASLLNLLPYLFILAWMPWAFMYGRRWLLEGDRRALAAAAFAFGMQILTAEPTTLVQVWMMAGVYTLYIASEEGGRAAWLRIARRLGVMFALSVSLGAVQLLPAIDHVGDSVRALKFPFDTVVSWSTPPARVVELLFPSFFGRPWFGGEGGYWGSIFYAPRPLPFLFSIYIGMPLIVLAVAGFMKGGRLARWVATSCGVAFLLAIGSATPLFRTLYELGPGQSFRYPEKFLIFILLAILVFALIGLERIGESRVLVSRVGVCLAALGLVVSLVVLWFLSGAEGLQWSAAEGGASTMAGAARLRDALRLDWVVNAVRFAAFGVLFITLRRGGSLRRWTAVLIVLGVLDLAPALRANAPSIDKQYFDPPDLAASLDDARDEWRVFPLANWYQSYGLSPEGSRFAESGEGTYWSLRNGMDPMLLSAWGFRQVLEIDYDRTALLPTTRMTEALWEIRNAVGDARDRTLMAMASARYFTRTRDFETEYVRAGSMRDVDPVAYIEVETNPIYWVPDRIESVSGKAGFVSRVLDSDPGSRTALIEGTAFEPARCLVRHIDERANSARIDLDCSGRSFLVAAVTPHKYWSARVDGEPAEIVTVNLAYSGVALPGGTREVVFTYRNPVVDIGAVASGLTLLVLLALVRRRTSHIG